MFNLINVFILVSEAGYLCVTNCCHIAQLCDITESDQKTCSIPFQYHVTSVCYITTQNNLTSEDKSRRVPKKFSCLTCNPETIHLFTSDHHRVLPEPFWSSSEIHLLLSNRRSLNSPLPYRFCYQDIPYTCYTPCPFYTIEFSLIS
jgi:hypothetical protein